MPEPCDNKASPLGFKSGIALMTGKGCMTVHTPHQDHRHGCLHLLRCSTSNPTHIHIHGCFLVALCYIVIVRFFILFVNIRNIFLIRTLYGKHTKISTCQDAENALSVERQTVCNLISMRNMERTSLCMRAENVSCGVLFYGTDGAHYGQNKSQNCHDHWDRWDE